MRCGNCSTNRRWCNCITDRIIFSQTAYDSISDHAMGNNISIILGKMGYTDWWILQIVIVQFSRHYDLVPYNKHTRLWYEDFVCFEGIAK